MSQRSATPGNDVQIYTPFRRGMPALGPYLRDLWGRRHFALELARTEIRTANASTGLGQLWLVLNPLLLTFVYYMLTSILSSSAGGWEFLAHIMAGLFLFYFFSTSVTGGASSILSSGRLIMNTAFPKMLLPLSIVMVSFMRFLPTLVIFAVVHTVADLPLDGDLLWGLIPLLEVVIFAAGLSMLFATLNLYFRDTKAFLPYVMRIWLYMSPILWYADAVADRQYFSVLKFVNPMYPMVGAWSESVVNANRPELWMFGAGAAWALGALVLGGYALLSREREFAVRL